MISTVRRIRGRLSVAGTTPPAAASPAGARRPARLPGAPIIALLLPLAAGCSQLRGIIPGADRFLGEPTHSAPTPRRPADELGAATWDAARREAGRRIVISIGERWLWLVEGEDTLFSAPAAVGMDETFTFRGRSYHFETPRGRLRVLGKEPDPRWVPPDWHYYEIAAEKELEPVFLKVGQRVRLSDGTTIEVRREGVGRVNRFGNFWPFTPGTEIIFDGKIFIPPFGTPQRRVPDVLGTHKIDLGDGYLIHGTNADDSIGRPVTHGCIRLHNDDIARLFAEVEKGTPVFIF